MWGGNEAAHHLPGKRDRGRDARRELQRKTIRPGHSEGMKGVHPSKMFTLNNMDMFGFLLGKVKGAHVVKDVRRFFASSFLERRKMERNH